MPKSLFLHPLVTESKNGAIVQAAALAKLFEWPADVRQIGAGGEETKGLVRPDKSNFSGVVYINPNGFRWQMRESFNGRWLEMHVNFQPMGLDGKSPSTEAYISVPSHGSISGEAAGELSKHLLVWSQRMIVVEDTLSTVFGPMRGHVNKLQRMCQEASDVWAAAWKQASGA